MNDKKRQESIDEQNAHNDAEAPEYVVGIGASAGGLEALEKLFRAMPKSLNAAYVVVQHLSPDFKSLMDELLERYTEMPVEPVTGSVIVEPNKIYLLPPKKEVIIDGARLTTYERPVTNSLSLPINVFFHSLAKTWKDKAVAIVLSGTGADGTLGISSIREHQGIVIAQLPESCRFDGMPQSAINTGLVDAILRPEEMPGLLDSIFKNPAFVVDSRNSNEVGLDHNLSAIYDALNAQFKNDFQHYKPSTIMRRIHRRIALHPGNMGIAEYASVLGDDKDELDQLYRDLLIGVTGFFRDPDAYFALEQTGFPSIFENLEDGNEEIRVWVCGCSTGEEAYSISIALQEAMIKHGIKNPVKIFATDLHPGSLQTASEGQYDSVKLENMPKHLIDKYFVQFDHQSYKVTPSLRKSIIFCEHNVLKNPPFTRMHLVTCRNLLIYFKVAAQVSAVTSFNFALNHHGILFLGASETPGELNTDFDVLDRHWKIYKKLRESHLRDALRNSKVTGRLTSVETTRIRADRTQSLGSLYNIILDKFMPAGILLNEEGELLHVFGDAHRFIKPPTGRVSGEVFPLLGSGLSIAVSTGLNNAKEQPGKMVYRGVRADNVDKSLEVKIEPIFEKISQRTYFMVSIAEESNLPLKPSLSTDKEIDFSLTEETAEYVHQLQNELQRTKEALQTSAEELETSNEELQASNEELLASNEELQSTNEELHSVNEELYTVNSEHEHKILELDRISGDLRNLVNSSELAMIFLNRDFEIRIFTPKATEVFNLVYQDIGRDIRHFMPKMLDVQLMSDLEETIRSESTFTCYLRAPDGSKVYERSCRIFSLTNELESGIVLSYRDVTELSQLRFKSQIHEFVFENKIQEYVVLDENINVLSNCAADHPLMKKMNVGESFETLERSLQLKTNERLDCSNQNSIKLATDSEGNQLIAHPINTPALRGWVVYI